MLKDLTQYDSEDSVLSAAMQEPEFNRLTPGDRTKFLDHWSGEYYRQKSNQAQRFAEQYNVGPDVTGRMNEQIGQQFDQYLGRDVGMVARAFLPSTNAQAMMDATMLVPAVGEAVGVTKPAQLAARFGRSATGVAEKILPKAAMPTARFGARVAKPALAGLIGGSLESGHRDPIGGLSSGVEQGALSEGLSLLGGFGKRSINRYDSKRIGDWLSSQTGQKLNNFKDYVRVFANGELQQKAEAAQMVLDDEVARKFIDKPMFSYQLTPAQADAFNTDPTIKGVLKSYLAGNKNALKELNDNTYFKIGENLADSPRVQAMLRVMDNIGWDLNNDVSSKAKGAVTRNAVHQIEGEFASFLDQHDPILASKWYNGRGRVRQAQTLTNMFREPGVLDNGIVNMEELQGHVAKGYKLDLQQAFGMHTPSELNSVIETGEPIRQELSRTTRRGASDEETDVTGHPPYGRAWFHGRGISGLLHPPTLARHVGYVPTELNRAKATQALLTLGPFRVTRALHNFFLSDMNDLSGEPLNSGPVEVPGGPDHVEGVK